MAEAILACAHDLGLDVPGDLSIVVLGDADPSQQPHAHAVPSTATDWSMFRIPRHEMGGHAVRVLVGLLKDPRAPAAVSALFVPRGRHHGRNPPLCTFTDQAHTH